MGTVFPEWMAWGVPIMADAALKGVVLLAAAGAATLAMRRASAAMRHLVWSLAILGLLALPVLSALLPQWQVLPQWTALRNQGEESFQLEGHAEPVLSEGEGSWPEVRESVDAPERAPPVMPQAVSVAEVPPVPVAAPLPTPIINNEVAPPSPRRNLPWRAWLPVLWALGAGLVLVPVVVGRLALWRLCRGARRIETTSSWTDLLRTLAEKLRLRQRIALLRSDRAVMPMAWGIRRARILLPGESDDWSAERRQLVLLHEMAHIHRRDCLTQFLTNLACAMHWFNPLVWIARRQMVAERERACDDLVLAAGFAPSDYAQELLHVASDLRGGLLTSGAAIAMARPSRLEGRLLAILDASRKRVMTPRGLWCCICALTVCAILLACTATPFRGGPIPAETLMANYRANPDRKTAQALADVLSFRNPSKEEAEDILRLLLDLKISVREKYAAGKRVNVRVEPPRQFTPSLTNFTAKARYTYFLDGERLTSMSTGRIRTLGPSNYGFGKLDIGVHEAVLRIECSLWPEDADRNEPSAYEFKNEIPITLNVVPDEEAEQVALVTNPALDAAIRSGIKAAAEPVRQSHNDYGLKGKAATLVDPMPVDLVLKVEFENEQGEIIRTAEPMHLIHRKSIRAETYHVLVPRPYDSYPLGGNRGKLILTPDPERAYLEPDIKKIWGGTLEIPVEFEVSRPEPDATPAPVEPQPDEAAEPRPRIEVSVQLVRADKEFLEKLQLADLPDFSTHFIPENTDWSDKALAKATVTVASGGKGSALLRTPWGDARDPNAGETTFRADLAPVLSVDGRFVTVDVSVSHEETIEPGERKQAMESTIRIPMNRAVLVGGSAGAPEDFWFIVGARMAPEEAALIGSTGLMPVEKWNEAPWGKAVEGVQVRLRGEKTIWEAGETSFLSADVRNTGEKQFLFAPAEEAACPDLEFDGKTYNWVGPAAGLILSDFPPAKSFRDIAITVGQAEVAGQPDGLELWATKDGTPLEVGPGKHVVRVTFTIQRTEKWGGGTIRVTSNPVEITVEPEAATKVIRYTVKGGDTLAAIAKQHLGSETKWRDIARENDLLSSVNLHLEIGDVLTITVPE